MEIISGKNIAGHADTENKTEMKGKEPAFQTEFYTGIRPTGELTVANYVGAVAPLLELQDKHPVVFVADLHAMTTNDPREVAINVDTVIDSYLAFGLNPEKVDIYIQSTIQPELGMLSHLLSNYVSLAELRRQPALKDKVNNPDKANAGLLCYPILMAADILSQDAHYVPVGDDQRGHVELTKVLAQRINNKFGAVVVVPELYLVKEPPRIRALKAVEVKDENGNVVRKIEKMSKSRPETAILMTDSPETARKKILKAETGMAGEPANELIKSLAILGENLAPIEQRPEVNLEMQDFIKKHESGEQVMGNFKNRIAEITSNFITDFQTRRLTISPKVKKELINTGNQIARNKIRSVLERLIDSGAISKHAKFW